MNWFAALHNRKPSSKELRNSIFIGALTPLLDDACDDLKIPVQDIRLGLLNGSEIREVAIAKKLWEAIEFGDKINLQNQLFKVLEAQEQSKEQFNPNISLEEIRNLSWDKANEALILFRLLFEEDLKAGELNFIAQLAFLMQLCNDVFDVWKDLQSGCFTLANSMKANDFNALLNREIEELMTLLGDLCTTDKNKMRSWKKISPILARALVASEQLLQLNFEPNLGRSYYQRSQLICDMEKPSNLFKSVSISAKLNLGFARTLD